MRVLIRSGALPSVTAVRNELAGIKGAHIKSGPRQLKIAGRPAFRVVYTTVSAPNQVTGKRVTLIVDRYYLPNGNQEAIVDLGTPQGVDNIDAYRLMIESFKWR